MKVLFLIISLLFTSCVSIPDNIKPVENFKIENYLGKWYEIARLDHRFERGLTQVTAQYSLREDGGVNVVNRGYSASTNEWKTAKGKAYFVDDPDKGFLKVSFFGPFYGSYIVFELDHEKYQYALVTGPDKTYLWILARKPDIAQGAKDFLVAKAASLGFDTSKLIFVDHDQ